MKDIIKDLMIKSGTHKYITQECQNRIEILAEYIVKECIDICEKGTVTQTTSSGAANMIRQRFGVTND